VDTDEEMNADYEVLNSFPYQAYQYAIQYVWHKHNPIKLGGDSMYFSNLRIEKGREKLIKFFESLNEEEWDYIKNGRKKLLKDRTDGE
jgi:hypothetical protein